MSVHRPGDVLAGRYRLADLLSETDRGRFWLAHDSILGRPVAVHVLDADDPRAPALMNAARVSASIADQRLLRVLDAETREGISYVVNEWGRGTSLDILLTRSGPLEPRRSAWITSQVAATLARAHELGHTHGRLNPENILIDDAGTVRIIGFAVEAALYGLPTCSAADDDTDLAAILAACLTGTWSGRTESTLPATPTSGGHPMRPRQVRAGVPKQLDDLCETALNPASRGRHEGPVLDARYLHDQLAAFLGDASDVAGLPAERPAAGATIRTALRLPPGRTPTATDGDGSSETAHDLPAIDLDAAAPSPDDHSGPADVPTEASLPSFEDDDSWHRPRETPAPPPPPLHAPEPKPLFADEHRAANGVPGQAPGPASGGSMTGRSTPARPPTGQPADAAGEEERFDDRTLAVAAPSADASAPSSGSDDYWPWGQESAPRRRNRWLPLLIGLVVLVLVVAAVLAVRSLSGGGTGSGTPSSSPSPQAAAKPIRNVTATDFDPLGNPPSENPSGVHYATDGNPETGWSTSTYTDQLGPNPPALKSGVGLVLDLHGSHTLDAVTLTVDGGATGVSFYVTDHEPTSLQGLHRVATATVTDREKVSLDNAKGSYLVVWLTSLPHTGGGYTGKIAEVSVTGSAH